ncbi:hypothetical protein [Lysobacter sp. A421]
MSALTLLHQDGRWLSFDGDQVTHLDARPKVDRATVVITDFDGAISQVTALEGSTSHATALIEKRLRADGLIDNESKILIHQTKTVGNGYQALFTAVPLDRWQQLFAWAEGQLDHCLLLPSVALLWHSLKPGRGIVLHSGRQFVFLASLRNRIVHASALAFSDSQDDLAMTVAALGERAGRDLAGDDEALETLTVEWVGVLTRAPDAGTTPATLQSDNVPGVFAASMPRADHLPGSAATAGDDDHPTLRAADQANGDVEHEQPLTFDGQLDPEYGHADTDNKAGDDDVAPSAEQLRDAARIAAPASASGSIASGRWTDEALLEIFSANSGTTVRLGAHALVTNADGVMYRSGVARLTASASTLIAVNPAASRVMYLAERLLPWASAASLLLAIALGGLGGRWTLAAHDANTRAHGLDDQITEIDNQIKALGQHQALPDTYPQMLRFLERADALQQALDPHASLATVREAAGDDVRILRLRLDKATMADGSDSLRVDGMVKQHDSDPQGMQVARFVERLRAAGFAATAVDPQVSGGRAQSPGGSFSYQLQYPQASATGATAGDPS